MANTSTLNISQQVIDNLIPALDATNYFLLGKSDLPRLDLFDFAFALGYNRAYPTKLDRKVSFVRQEGIGNEKFLYESVYYKQVVDGDADKVDKILEEPSIFAMAEEFAETGFSIISDARKNDTAENFCLSLLSELDEMYKEFEEDMKSSQ